MIKIVDTSNNVFNQEVTMKLTFGEILTISKCFDVVLDMIDKNDNRANADNLIFDLGRIVNDSQSNNIIMLTEDVKENIEDMNGFLDTQLNALGVKVQLQEPNEDMYLSYDRKNVRSPYEVISKDIIQNRINEKIK